MTKLSNKEAALLGLLSEKPKHAYEIKNDIQDRDMGYWTEISTSSIYKLLNKLEERGFLISETRISEKNVVQKVYTLTAQGKDSLEQKMEELISVWEPAIHPIDISLAHLDLLDKEQTLEGLAKYDKSLDKFIKCYQELEDFLVNSKCPIGNIQLATRRLYLLKAEKEWLKSFLEEFQVEP
jgi:DNA-binding PadR family transcriptional regulator